MPNRSAFPDEQSRWNALTQRNSAAEGTFFYGVRTTGVVCRPGCPSRLPKRDNVEFFASISAAQGAGYRPCKRCVPGGTSARQRQEDIIVSACRRLEEAETPPTLAVLAAEAGLSPAHFQRRFRAAVGLSPRQYASAHQARRFRASLETGETITDALYSAGFNSSSCAYAQAREHLAMTPTAYRKGAPGKSIRYSIAPCYLGWMVVAATDRGICAIEFGDEPALLPAQLQRRFPKAQLIPADGECAALVEDVIRFIEQPGHGPELPLDIQGTAFQQRVWQALRDIPPGATASYAEIAARIGSPGGGRAVAGACAANSLAVVIPCHRVVRGSGALSGYRWGVERKRALLLKEGTAPGAPKEQQDTPGKG